MEEQPLFDIEKMKKVFEETDYYKEKEMPKTLFNIPSNNQLPDSFKKYFGSYTKNAITRGKMEIF